MIAPAPEPDVREEATIIVGDHGRKQWSPEAADIAKTASGASRCGSGRAMPRKVQTARVHAHGRRHIATGQFRPPRCTE